MQIIIFSKGEIMSYYRYFGLFLAGLILTMAMACSAAGSGTAAGDLFQVGSLTGNNSEVMKSLSMGSSLLFASAEFSGITMIDVSDISNLSIIGTNYNVPSSFPVNDVYVEGDFVFLALGNFDETGGLAVVDKSDTNNVVVLVTRNTVAGANSRALYVVDAGATYNAYVADENLGLCIYSINTGGPTIGVPTTISLPIGQAVDIVVNGTTAYIAAKNGGVYVITDLGGTPTISAQISYEISDARGVALSGGGDTLFVADRMMGVWAYDVSNPSKPGFIGSYTTVGEANAVIANGDDVYVADGSNGILWLDFTTPSQPYLKKENPVKQGMVWDLVLVNSFIVGAYGPDGVKVFAR